MRVDAGAPGGCGGPGGCGVIQKDDPWYVKLMVLGYLVALAFTILGLIHEVVF